MSVTKMWVFIIGLAAGAAFLGDAGGDAIRDIVSSLRAGASGLMDTGGGGLSDFGDAIQ